MTRRKTREEWLEEAKQVLVEVEGFNGSHPHSTWVELEGAIDDALAGWRHSLLEGSVQGRALADFRGAVERPVCPHCGMRLRASGQYSREVAIQGEQTVRLERTRGRCPGCGAGLFPPG